MHAYTCVCVRERTHTCAQYLMPLFMLSLSIKPALIYTEKLFISKTSSYITAIDSTTIHIHFLSLNIFIPSPPPSTRLPHQILSVHAKSLSSVSLSILICQISILNHYPVCVSSCHISHVGDASKETNLYYENWARSFCVWLTGH